MNKKIILPVTLAVIITGAAAFGAIGVSAQNTADTSGSLVQRIAQRFNLQESEVQSVFDEFHEEHHQQMQAKLEEHLDEAVQKGTITEEQKNLIIAKHAELQREHEVNREKMENMTPEERKEVIEAYRAEMEAWYEENGIDMRIFFIGGMKGMHKVMHVK